MLADARPSQDPANLAMFERLEDRLFLAYGGALWAIFGDKNRANYNDTIIVDRDPDDPSILRATVNGTVIGTRPESRVGSIWVFGGRGDDTIKVDTSGGQRLIRCFVHGGPGDDSLTGGAEVDYLYGGAGSDTLRGGGGKDFLVGGLGKDSLYVDPGDRVWKDRGDVFVQDAAANPLRPIPPNDALKAQLIEAALRQWHDLLGSARTRWWELPSDISIALPSDISIGWLPPVTGRVLAGAVTTAFASNGVGPQLNGSPSHSDTNTQEAGVDEADIGKTDGSYLYMLSAGKLVIVDSWPVSRLHVESRSAVEGAGLAMYLYGDRVTVLSQIASVRPNPRPREKPKVKVTVFDVTDRSAPALVEETYLDGGLLESRAIDGRVFVIVRNTVLLPEPLLRYDAARHADVYESEADYEQRLSAQPIEELLPCYATKAAGSGGTATVTGSLLGGAGAYILDRPETSDLLSVAAFDVTDDVGGPDSTTSALGTGAEVYASADSLYVVSQANAEWRGGWWCRPTTFIHKFDLRADGVPLVATGSVAGAVVNQFSMDEEGGYFRIATTERQDNPPPGWPQRGLSNNVFVMRQVGDSLDVVGSLTGLAPDERIQSVRFLGDRGYVVTFKTVDPLFVLDLSEPAGPKVAGELHMPGFSTYLHPIDDGHLIGFGRDANAQTGRYAGLQVSLFDVSDPAHPVQVERQVLAPASRGDDSEALLDHHAFAYFPDSGVMAVPVSEGWGQARAALRVFKVDPEKGFTLLGEIQHDTAVRRSFQIGDYLFSISSNTIKANDIAHPSHEVAALDLKA
jgi:uncharacterized secreted protein with C-terminal beta-propeller domain